ncbi:hypothetical protein K8I28_01500 [bacterium]|nr:hypothetical protein [bacterium]
MIKLKIGYLAPVFLLLSLVLFVGCPDDGIKPPDGNNIRPIGPPLYEISFCDPDRAIGTIDISGDSLGYFDLTGAGGEFGDASFAPLYAPSTTRTRILAGMLETVDGLYTVRIIEAPNNDQESFEIKEFTQSGTPGMMTWSGGGSRVFYISETLTEYSMYRESVDLSDSDLIAVLEKANYRVRPGLMSVAGFEEVVISVYDIPNNYNMLMTYEVADGLQETQPISGLSPQFSNDGNKIACILDGESSNNETSVLIMNSQLSPIDTVDFGHIATGAKALVWSPDDNKIALYAGMPGNDTKLIMIQGGAATEIPIDRTIVVPEEEEWFWAVPSWNPESNRLALMVENGNDALMSVAVTDLTGQLTILKNDLHLGADCRPDWKK